MSPLDYLQDPEIIRPLLVTGVGALITMLVRALKRQRKDAEEKRETLNILENAVRHLGTETQGLKQAAIGQADTNGAIRETMQLVASRLESIEHETKTNTGSSLKDAINRIEARQTLVLERVGVEKDRMDAHLRDTEYKVKRLDDVVDLANSLRGQVYRATEGRSQRRPSPRPH